MHDGILERQQQRAGAEGVEHAHAQRDPHAILHSFEVACAIVLAHEGRRRHAETGDGQDVEAVDFHIGRKACHGGGTVAVDAGLHQHIRERDDHVLDAGGKADADDAGGHPLIGPDGGKLHLVVGVHLHQKAEAQHTGDELADVGGDGCARHAHLQPGDEHEVEDDVGDGGAGKVEDRAPGVACRVEDARRHIIDDAEQHAAEVELHVGDGIAQHFVGGVHPDQQGAADCDAAHREDEAEDGRDGQRGVDGDAGLLFVLRAEVLAHHDACAHGHALTETDEQVDGRAAGAYCGQRIAAQKVADDDGVGGVVELLEQVAKDERHREEQDALPDAALGHEQGLFLLLCRVGHSSSLPQKTRFPEILHNKINNTSFRAECQAERKRKLSGFPHLVCRLFKTTTKKLHFYPVQ